MAAVLIQLGPTQAALPNLVLVAKHAHVRVLIDALLGSGHRSPGSRDVSIKNGPAHDLRALAGGTDDDPIEPAVVPAPTRFSGGWVVIRDSKGTVALRQLAGPLPEDLAAPWELWGAARLSANGIVDWSRTVKFARATASTARPARPRRKSG